MSRTRENPVKMHTSPSPRLESANLRIAVLVADPTTNRMISRSVRSDSRNRCVGSWSHIVESLAEIEGAKPDVVLIGLDLPGGKALSTTKWLRRILPDALVIAITSRHDQAEISEILGVGAVGCLSASAFAPDAAPGLLSVMGALRPARDSSPETGVSEPSPLLTQREAAVMRLVANGLINKEIADRMKIGTATVCSHLKNIYRKLDANTRTEAVLKCFGAPQHQPC